MSHKNSPAEKIENDTDQLIKEIEEISNSRNPKLDADNAKATLLEIGAAENTIRPVLENKPTQAQEPKSENSRVFRDTHSDEHHSKVENSTSQSKK